MVWGRRQRAASVHLRGVAVLGKKKKRAKRFRGVVVLGKKKKTEGKLWCCCVGEEEETECRGFDRQVIN